jgi:hypothetical protein
MRQFLLLVVLLFSVSPVLYAQRSHYLEVPRYEVGIQFNVHYLDGVGEWGGGVGARFHYNFDEHFALDSELTYRQHDVSNIAAPIPVPGVVGQTSGLFGIRAGQRFNNTGAFVHARAGFIHFGADHGVTLLTRNTVPAFDVGATFERYSGPAIFRFDLGEMIVSYGNAIVAPGPLLLPPQPPPGRLGTRASPAVGIGFAIRF